MRGAERLLGCLGLAALLLGCQRGEAVPGIGHPRHVAHEGVALEPESRRAVLERLPEVERLVGRAFEEAGLPSLAFAVLVDGEIAWWRGLGSPGEGRAVTPSTVYRVGSITKVVTGMALLRLRDEGVLALDEPAARLLPEIDEVIYPTADSPVITLRHLLTHTSGLPRLGRFDYAGPRTEPVSEGEVLASLPGLKLESAPGTAWTYSNLGYALLGLSVGRAVRADYRDFVGERILAPLGIPSRWDAERIDPRLLATGYAIEKGRPVPRHRWLMGAAEGMGGLYASLEDLAKLVGYQMTAWPPGARPDRPPLRSATLRESHMIGGLQAPGRQGTGIGWGVVELGRAGHVVFHTGATATYAATAMFSPRGRFGVVALTNCGCPEAVDGLGGRAMMALAEGAGEKKRRRLR